MNNNIDKILTVITYLLVSSSPVIGAFIFSSTKNIKQAFWFSFLFFTVGLIVSFFTQIWNRLQEKWVSTTVRHVDNFLQNVFSNFKKKYYSFLFYRHRDFDVKGLDTQGIYNLELNQVFVDLAIAPQSIFQTSIIPTTNEEYRNKPTGNQIWKYLENDAINHKLAVIGPPGSGKTTLLKHITLVLVGQNKTKRKFNAPNKIPVLLFIREHQKDIINNQDINLSQIIELALSKYKVTPPPLWFEKNLIGGKCIIMLDGLDEVANPDERKKIGAWVERQIVIYNKNDFIITSRPLGYRGNQLTGVTLLEIVPFNIKQVQNFINNWYLANEIRASGKNDLGVKLNSEEGAQDLIKRLRKTPVLLELAVNPLLLTMIATVHRYRSSLPGRRVELYEEISKVFLGKRQQSRDIEIELSPSQSQTVLQHLAYSMMKRHALEVSAHELDNEIGEALSLVGFRDNGEEFVKWVEASSGLLLERGVGIYSFCHKTFQEYLAAAYISEKRLDNELIEYITDTWWYETIRLFCAQADATSIIYACLKRDTLETQVLTLAIQCLQEALSVNKSVRLTLENKLKQDIEHEDPERRKVVAQALLALRSLKMERLEENTYFDPIPITNAEFQLFLNDYKTISKYFHPIHWKQLRSLKGTGGAPVSGISVESVDHFCEWLSTKGTEDWHYRLPKKEELDKYEIKVENSIWIFNEKNPKKSYEVFKVPASASSINYELITNQLSIDVYKTINKDEIRVLFELLGMKSVDINALIEDLKKITLELLESRLKALAAEFPVNLDLNIDYDLRAVISISTDTYKSVTTIIEHTTQQSKIILTYVDKIIDLLTSQTDTKSAPNSSLFKTTSTLTSKYNRTTKKTNEQFEEVSKQTREILKQLENIPIVSHDTQKESKKSTEVLDKSLDIQKSVYEIREEVRQVQIKLSILIEALQRVKYLITNNIFSTSDKSKVLQSVMMDLSKALDINRSLEKEKVIEDQQVWVSTNTKKQRFVEEFNKIIENIHIQTSEILIFLSAIKNDLIANAIKPSTVLLDWKYCIDTFSQIQRDIGNIIILTLPFSLLQNSLLQKLLYDVYHHHYENIFFNFSHFTANTKIQYTKSFALLSTISLLLIEKNINQNSKEKLNSLAELNTYFLHIYLTMSVLDSQINEVSRPLDNLCLIKYHQ